MGALDKYTTAVSELDPIKYTGTVTRVRGLLIESHGPIAEDDFPHSA